MDLSEQQENELLYVGFNQDYGCFACGTDTGFRIYNCDPFRETFRRDFTSGGIGIVEMLFRCNILALVGGGKSPRYPSNKVMIWDDHQNLCIGELSFRSEVKAVRLRRDRVVVVLEKKIYVYNFADLKLVDHIETTTNTKGICALCTSTTNTVLACPGLQRGHVRVELYDIRKTTLIPAHETDLACIALSLDGMRLATASDKGTLVRVFDTQTGQIQHELRRGVDRAVIYSLCFNASSQYVACSSDKGTVHVFSIGEGDGKAGDGGASGDASGAAGGGGSAGGVLQAAAGGGGDEKEEDTPAKVASNSKSNLSFMKGFLPKYFSSEWSYAQFRIPEQRALCAFGSEKDTLVVVTADGSFYKANYAMGGECEKTSFSKFVQGPADDDE